MKSHFIGATVLIFSCVACAQTNWSPNSFCIDDGDECPEYTDVASNTNFVERSYKTSRWLMTKIEDPAGLSTLMAAVRKLDNYIANVFEDRFPKTKPTAITILYSDDRKESYFVSYYVPPEIDISNSTDRSISLYTMDACNMFIRTFSGQPYAKKLLMDVNKLEKDLNETRKRYEHSRHMVMFYEAPSKLWFRHDEVWIPAA